MTQKRKKSKNHKAVTIKKIAKQFKKEAFKSPKKFEKSIPWARKNIQINKTNMTNDLNICFLNPKKILFAKIAKIIPNTMTVGVLAPEIDIKAIKLKKPKNIIFLLGYL